MHARFLIIGGGLSGLAAAIRLARYNNDVLLLEKHSRPGGLNSFYFRNNRLFETGLHAITNFAPSHDKQAPLNRLLRQLKISYDDLAIKEQISSEICFPGKATLSFSNDFNLLCSCVETEFKAESDSFVNFANYLDSINPFEITPYKSARNVLAEHFHDPLLIEMLLCPILYYGSSWENDIDFNQFVIMFRAIFKEGMFRPGGTIKDLLDLLVLQLTNFGGTLKLKTTVKKLIHKDNKIVGVLLDDQSEVTCDYCISTTGLTETDMLLGIPCTVPEQKRLGFTENIFQLDEQAGDHLSSEKTIIFFNTAKNFSFKEPEKIVDFSSGVICMPNNFKDFKRDDKFFEVRTTHLSNYGAWQTLSADKYEYCEQKKINRHKSRKVVEKIIGPFSSSILFEDSFTPLTIEKFTGKIKGAIYGSPQKAKDGTTGFDNLFIAGTDQGFLGIVGSMLSGVSVVNQNIFKKI